MSRWGPALRLIGAAVASYWLGPGVFLQQLQYEEARRRRDSTNRSARQRYNDAQVDRLQMLDMEAAAPRTLVLGRTRTVEGVRARWSSGTNKEKLTLIVSLAGHEIDAIETWYLDDNAVTLDGSGWVQESPYRTTTAVAATEALTLNSSGGGTLTLAHTPNSGTVSATWSTGNIDYNTGTCSVAMAGADATVSGGHPNAYCVISYEYNSTVDRVRIRPYLGTATQSVGADLSAEYPGELDSTDHFRGIALAVMDVIYDPDVFPTGAPRLTAVVRGAKVYDPRLDSTVSGGSGSHREATASTWEWSENPALLAYHYARHANGWAVPAAEIRTADVMDAADDCDVSTNFTLRMPDTSTDVVTLPRYRCGLVISTADQPAAAMEDILETMAGKVGWSGGTLRMRAGAMAASVATIDESWIAAIVGTDGKRSADPVVQIADAYTRDRRVNRVIGACVDATQRYQSLPFPSVADSTYIAAEGELQADISFAGVTHVAHAQHLSSIIVRETHAGLSVELRCNLNAWRLELLDVVTVTLQRYGFSAKTFEVTGWRWDPEVGVVLKLAEIAAAMFTVDAELTGRDPAPNSTLPNPRDVPAVTGVAVSSGTTALSDASTTTRVDVTWTAITQANIASGGQIEVQYWPALEALPATGQWLSASVQGGSARATLTGLKAGQSYLFRVRAVQAMPYVRGAWSSVLQAVVASLPRVRRNLVDAGWWAVGADVASVWDEASTGNSTTTIVQATMPDGVTQKPVVRAYDPDASGASGYGGGWEAATSTSGAPTFPVDRSKIYLFAVPFMRVAGSVGNLYAGPARFTASEGPPVCDINTTTLQTAGGYALGSLARSSMTVGVWYVAVWFVYPYASTGNPTTNGGIFDATTGVKLANCTNFNWHADSTYSTVKAFQFYTGTGDESYIGEPQCYVCDGTQPSLSELLATALGNTATWSNVTNRPTTYRAISRGYSNMTSGTPYTTGALLDGETDANLVAEGSMYRVIKIARATGVVTNVGAYNPFADAANATAMAAALNAIGSDHIVVVVGADEPQTNRLANGLDAAMYRHGASRAVFGSPEFKFRAAYVLVGIGACGEGNGYEAYQGDTDSDANAWCDVAFTVYRGLALVSGTTHTPRTLADYSAGALAMLNTVGTSQIDPGAVSQRGQTSVSGASLYSGSATSSYSNQTVDGPTFTTTANGRVFGAVTGRVSVTLDTSTARFARPAFVLQLVRTSDSTVMDETGIFGTDTRLVESAATSSVLNCSGSVMFDAVAAGTYKVRLKVSMTITDAGGTGAASMTASGFTGEISGIELKV